MSRLNLWKPEPKRRAGIVRPPVVPGLSLSRYSNTELGVRIARRSNLPKQDPGVAWARLMSSSNRPEKDEARDAVLQLFTPGRFPKLSILTFPASKWVFEHRLLAMREPTGVLHRTQILAIERDVAVFRAGCHNIPIGDKKRNRVLQLTVPPFATANVRTHQIGNFLCCTFEDYAGNDRIEKTGGPIWFDAAWLDFTGQLTPSRFNAIKRFWSRQIKSTLVITLLNGRTCDWINGRIRHHGSVEHLLRDDLEGSEIQNTLRYGDGAPMIQVTLERASGMPRNIAECQARKIGTSDKSR